MYWLPEPDIEDVSVRKDEDYMDWLRRNTSNKAKMSRAFLNHHIEQLPREWIDPKNPKQGLKHSELLYDASDEDDAGVSREPRVRGRAPIFEPGQRAIASLMDDIERDVIALPDLQRPFVWEDTKVRDLLDSLFVGYPVGTLVFWHTSNDRDARALGAERPGLRATTLVIDGQQRLTSPVAQVIEVFRKCTPSAWMIMSTRRHVSVPLEIAFSVWLSGSVLQSRSGSFLLSAEAWSCVSRWRLKQESPHIWPIREWGSTPTAAN